MDDVVKRACLGQSCGLGDIYDAAVDQLVGSKLLTESQLAECKKIKNHGRQQDFTVIVDNGYPSAFSLLQVPSDQQASYLVGMLDAHLSGSSLFLKDEKGLERSIRSVIKLSIKTKTETLDFASRTDILANLASTSTSTDQGTHVVSEIEWGSNLIAVFDYKNEEHEEEAKVATLLQSYVQKLANSIALGPLKKLNHKTRLNTDAIKVKMYCDCDDASFLRSISTSLNVLEAVNLFKKFPSIVEKEKGGFGKPMNLILAPLKNLNVLEGPTLIPQDVNDAYFSEGCMPMSRRTDPASYSNSSTLTIEAEIDETSMGIRRMAINTDLENYFSPGQSIASTFTALESEERCVVAPKGSNTTIPFGHLETLLYPSPITAIVGKLYSNQETLTTVEKLVVVFEKMRMDLQKLESECNERKEMKKYTIKLKSSDGVESLLSQFKEMQRKFIVDVKSTLKAVRRGQSSRYTLGNLILKWETHDYWGGRRGFVSVLNEHIDSDTEKRNLFRQLMSRKVRAVHHDQLDAFVNQANVAAASTVVLFYKTPRRDEKNSFNLNCKFFLTCLYEKCETENKIGSYDAGNAVEIHNVIFEKNLKTPINYPFNILLKKSDSDKFLVDLQKIPPEVVTELLGGNDLNECFEIYIVGKIDAGAQRVDIELRNDADTMMKYESNFDADELILKRAQGNNWGNEERHELQLKRNAFFTMRICRDPGGLKVLVDGEPEINYYNQFQCSSPNMKLLISGEATISVIKVDLLQENKSSGIFHGFPFVDKKAQYVFVDCDLLDEDQPCKVDSTVIHIYENSKIVSKNLLKDSVSYLSKRIVKCTKPMKKVYMKPRKRTFATMKCPGSPSFGGNCICGGIENVWLCWKCQDRIEFGFDDHFYCSCGKEQVFNFRFRCEGETQTNVFLEFKNKADLTGQLQSLEPFKEMNILLLGGTGVGKSTWINGLANYLTYETLEEAMENEIVALIPSSFILTNDNFEEVVISVGRDSNEVLVSGQSATQQPTSYTFINGNTLVRIIDTPGIGDTRGISQDKINFQGILSHISNIDQLHGICILLKPNEARLGIVFEFCLKELLTHLHRDAADNIAFCFTNARSTFYRPGDTMAALKSLIASQPLMSSLIKLNKDTVYCMDNEAFRFLAAIKHGEEFDDEEKNNFSVSWTRSVNETGRLMDHFKAVKPHGTANTVTLNSTRQIILKLARPIAEISQNIQTNIALLKDRENELSNSNAQFANLASRLHVPQTDLEVVELGYPKTVCGSSKCIENLVMGTTSDNKPIFKAHYKQVCHAHCGISGVVTNTMNVEALKGCWAMTRTGSVVHCAWCRCCWSTHLHITYDTIQRTVTTADKNVELGLLSAEQQKSKIEAVVKQCKDRFATYEDEQKKITKASAQFAVFLKNNAITPYNDALVRYLDHIINVEEEKIRKKGNQATRDGLQKMKEAYVAEVQLLENAIKDPTTAAGASMTPESIQEALNALYKLPLSGPTIKKLIDTTQNTERIMFAEKSFMRKTMLNRYKMPGGTNRNDSASGSGSGSAVQTASYFKRKFTNASSQAQKWF